MATATSNVFSVLISQALAAVWSKENVSGTYDPATDTWTPGRGSDGRITETSWAQVPLNRWVRVAGTRMDVLDAVVKAAIPGWKDRGTGGFNGVIKAWSGMAVDSSQPRAFFFGGGHHDSSNNGVYRLDFNKMAWAVQKMPTDSALFDSRYNTTQNGTFTVYPPAQDYQTANPTDYSVMYDCFYPFAPNEPTARHTYGGLAYSPERNELFMGCRRMWQLNLGTGQWSVTNQSATLPNSGVGENMFVWWDKFRGRYVINATQNGNAGKNIEFDPVTKSCFWSSANLNAGDYYWATAACEYEGMVYAYMRPDHGGRVAELQSLNVQTNVRTLKTITGDSADTFNTNFYDGGSLCFVPEKGQLLSASWSTSQNKLRLYWIDPASGVMSAATEAGNFYTVPHSIVETKMQYIKHLRAVVFVDSADNDIRIMRTG